MDIAYRIGGIMPAVRLSDVAKDAGVSLATASRVLNGSARTPGRAVAEKVRASAAKLGYVTNAQAQALARSRSGLIGLVVHDIADPYFAVLARAVQQRIFASDSQVLLTQTDRDPETEIRAIRSLIAQRVDALVLFGSHRYGADTDSSILQLLQGFEAHGGLVVCVGQAPGVGRTIVTEDAATAHELATSLVVEGHRRFAVPQGISGIPTAAHRTGGFLAGLAEAGIEVELYGTAGLNRSGGHAFAAQVAEHLASPEGVAATEASGGLPLCVFAPADVMALGVLGELRRHGLRIPEQVAVAGFGGVPGAHDSSPVLTTVALPLEEMAEQVSAWILSEQTGAAEDSSDRTGRDQTGSDQTGPDPDGRDQEGRDQVRDRRMHGEILLRESTAL
ncbi:LacI family DNA-binding transcriptional regulator [Brachybacterium hainanense]|uniref:LacI family DNA-binding transcriptional regulator n=1 Tax=Brachybacterium hainanense TaxID=1541174 RepID=A0ABV6R9T9_9MICO